jgi:hypothetical protein
MTRKCCQVTTQVTLGPGWPRISHDETFVGHVARLVRAAGSGVSRRSGRGNPARNTAECHRVAVSPGGRTERHVLTLARPEKRVRQQKFNPTGFAPTNLTVDLNEMTIGSDSTVRRRPVCGSAAPAVAAWSAPLSWGLSSRKRQPRKGSYSTGRISPRISPVESWSCGYSHRAIRRERLHEAIEVARDARNRAAARCLRYSPHLHPSRSQNRARLPRRAFCRSFQLASVQACARSVIGTGSGVSYSTGRIHRGVRRWKVGRVDIPIVPFDESACTRPS